MSIVVSKVVVQPRETQNSIRDSDTFTVRSMLSKTAQSPFRALFAPYKDFLTLWKDANPDISILKQTKAEYRGCNSWKKPSSSHRMAIVVLNRRLSTSTMRETRK